MIEQYKKPTVKFTVNKGNFNKLMTLLTFQEENIVTDWKEKATNLKDSLLRYSIPQKDEDGDIAIIDIALFPNESSELTVLLLSALDVLVADKDYTQFMKRK